MGQTVAEVVALLREATEDTFPSLERALAADTRKGVIKAVETARRRIADEKAESERIDSLYEFQAEVAARSGSGFVVGLDEVGRGPVAGPLAVGAVVLPAEPRIAGLNDSKQVKPDDRERIAEVIKQNAIAWAVEMVEPGYIDNHGMTASLKKAFSQAVAKIEAQGIEVGCILLDGNPLRFDPREVNVVKGDAKCASIAAASIVAKVERDALMCAYAKEYPQYHFEGNKGYASADHIEAIKQTGLSPIHRVSFCTAFTQETLF